MAILKAKQFQKGLTVRHRGDFVEKVSSKSADVGLISAHQQVEVAEVLLRENMRLFLTPAGAAVETFYVLSGRVACMLPSGLHELDVGDCVITETLEEPTHLLALSDTRLLYVTSQPQFHVFSETLSQLRKMAIEVELKDGYTAEHCERLQALSFATGQELGLESNRLFLLDYGAYLHDLGKVHVPLEILNKPAKLSEAEWDIVKRHPTSGRELLDKTHLKGAGKIVEQHHERTDGSGYPYGLTNDEVLVEASIVAVADTYDAMTTDRSYRKALSQADALEEIRRFAGIHYPKEVVKAFLVAVKRIEQDRK